MFLPQTIASETKIKRTSLTRDLTNLHRKIGNSARQLGDQSCAHFKKLHGVVSQSSRQGQNICRSQYMRIFEINLHSNSLTTGEGEVLLLAVEALEIQQVAFRVNLVQLQGHKHVAVVGAILLADAYMVGINHLPLLKILLFTVN